MVSETSGSRLVVIAEPPGVNGGSAHVRLTARVVELVRRLGGVRLIWWERRHLELVAGWEGVEELLCADYPAIATGSPRALVTALATWCQQQESLPTHIIAVESSWSAAIMPGLAALLDGAWIGSVSGVVDGRTFSRPIHAGNFLERVTAVSLPVVLTVRPGRGEPAAAVRELPAPVRPLVLASGGELELVPVPEVLVSRLAPDRPELATARRVVAGGRGAANREEFALIERLAVVLGAAVGASRGAVDAGLAPSDWQIGQTGKVIAPELYLAVGISGALQHLAGAKDARVIAAINHDPAAPILAVADLGWEADLRVALPELISLVNGGE